jgi:hypothetical protein
MRQPKNGGLKISVYTLHMNSVKFIKYYFIVIPLSSVLLATAHMLLVLLKQVDSPLDQDPKTVLQRMRRCGNCTLHTAVGKIRPSGNVPISTTRVYYFPELHLHLGLVVSADWFRE